MGDNDAGKLDDGHEKERVEGDDDETAATRTVIAITIARIMEISQIDDSSSDEEMPNSQETAFSSLSASSREVKSLSTEFGWGGRIIKDHGPPIERKRTATRVVTPYSSGRKRAKVAMTETVITWERVSSTNNQTRQVNADNIILNFESLVSVIGNLRCKCRGKLSVERITVGITTSLNFLCQNENCDRMPKGMAVKPKIVESKWMSQDEWDRTDTTKPLPARCYQENIKSVIGMQLTGGGQRDFANIMSKLGIASDPLQNQWSDLERIVARAEIMLAEEQMKENLKAEVEATKMPENGDSKIGISVASDTAWNKRSYRASSHDSASGHSLVTGALTKLVLACHCMSTVCSHCPKVHEFAVDCPNNYNGSSKGMEGRGTYMNVMTIFGSNLNCYVKTITADDDSSAPALLRHSFKDLQEQHNIPWPRTASGGKKKDTGLLPLEHPPIKFQADHNHRWNCLASDLFKLSSKKRSETKMTRGDAERLKHYAKGCGRQHRKDGDWTQFQSALFQSLEHHFDIHTSCGDWCAAKLDLASASDDEEIKRKKQASREKKKLKYRSKIRDPQLFDQLRSIFEKFATKEWLEGLMHDNDSNKVEAMNSKIAHCVPKDRYYASTIANKGRTHLVVMVDSVGYVLTTKNLYKQLRLTLGTTDEESMRRKDVRKALRKENNESIAEKKARGTKKREKRSTQRAKLVADQEKALTHERGQESTVATGGDRQCETMPSSSSTAMKAAAVICPFCKERGHKTRRSKKCKQHNLSTVPGEDKEMRETSEYSKHEVSQMRFADVGVRCDTLFLKSYFFSSTHSSFESYTGQPEGIRDDAGGPGDDLDDSLECNFGEEDSVELNLATTMELDQISLGDQDD
jgi:hypothetical protein